MENVDSSILDNICEVLQCARADIGKVSPLQEGLTNLSVVFSCRGERYVYRYPGAGTDELINREAECFALEAASDLGLDTTFVFEDPATGWKLSRFYPVEEPFSYEDNRHVTLAMKSLKKLHDSDVESSWSFDFYEEGSRILNLLETNGVRMPVDFPELKAAIDKIITPMRAEAGQPVLCHNDFYAPNLLVGKDELCVIDWEYAAMGDYGCDLGNFVAQGSGYSVEEALSLLPLYFGREATDEERRHLGSLHCRRGMVLVRMGPFQRSIRGFRWVVGFASGTARLKNMPEPRFRFWMMPPCPWICWRPSLISWSL